jgi:hypothetical protein
LRSAGIERVRSVADPVNANDVHSVLLQPAIDFTIDLPPRRVDRNTP